MELVEEKDLTGVYREGRWEYMREVVELVKIFGFSTILEMGARDNPIVKGCDTMDEVDNYRSEKPYPVTYLFDATRVPRPIDKHYDCFIALECFEHLGNSQTIAFKEAERLADNIILSLPYKHDCPGDCHHGIDEHVIASWVNGRPFEFKVVRGRIICFFKSIK